MQGEVRYSFILQSENCMFTMTNVGQTQILKTPEDFMAIDQQVKDKSHIMVLCEIVQLSSEQLLKYLAQYMLHTTYA